MLQVHRALTKPPVLAQRCCTVLANISQHTQSLCPLPPRALLQHPVFLAASPQSLPYRKGQSCASHPVLGLDMVFEIHFPWGKARVLCRHWAVHWCGRQGSSAGKSFFRLGPFHFWKLFPERTNLASSDWEKKSIETVRVKIFLYSY